GIVEVELKLLCYDLDLHRVRRRLGQVQVRPYSLAEDRQNYKHNRSHRSPHRFESVAAVRVHRAFSSSPPESHHRVTKSKLREGEPDANHYKRPAKLRIDSAAVSGNVFREPPGVLPDKQIQRANRDQHEQQSYDFAHTVS